MLDPKNAGIAVGITLITCLRAQRHANGVERSPSWILIFPLPVWSLSILVGFNVMLDPENIGKADEILLISCQKLQIHAFVVLRPPSWNANFRFGCTVSQLVS